MRSQHLLILKGIVVVLTLAHLTTCSPPPPPRMTQAHFNCPDVPAPLDFRQYPNLYLFCISQQAQCDCYEAPQPDYPLRYHPICDMEGHAAERDLELRAAHGYCEDTCMCYGGPPENWSRWPDGPWPVGPRIPITQLQNGS